MTLTNNYQSMAELKSLAGKCPRCSLCKFPPLVAVRDAGFSSICPAYEVNKMHASSGGGMLVMGMSLLEGRSEVTDRVRRIAQECTACGGCDIACKFSSDIEVLEVIFQLRAHIYKTAGAAPAHEAVLQSMRARLHPLVTASGALGDWLKDVPAEQSSTPDYLLWVGPHYALLPELRTTLTHALKLLAAGGVRYAVLGASEPYTGRAALEIGDRELFASFARRAAAAVAASSAKGVVCLSAEDYATFRALLPRFSAVGKPVLHVVELYDQLIRDGKLKPAKPVARALAWHDPSYLGRLSEPWTSWSGERVKTLGQMILETPPRPVNRGDHGCYDAPRRVLSRVPGLRTLEFFRRREYAFDSGECGQALAVAPGFALSTAQHRLAEARAVGADAIVTECPQSASMLRAAASSSDGTTTVQMLTDVLFESVLA
ncbi:MAG: (Fe-S)-binding protein [Candidatus Schekmanbacteria bacterium]|nr:(Fe-S)-binding protein [Candidatus Schekmanbacteria bacterium]